MLFFFCVLCRRVLRRRRRVCVCIGMLNMCFVVCQNHLLLIIINTRNIQRLEICASSFSQLSYVIIIIYIIRGRFDEQHRCSSWIFFLFFEKRYVVSYILLLLLLVISDFTSSFATKLSYVIIIYISISYIIITGSSTRTTWMLVSNFFDFF